MGEKGKVSLVIPAHNEEKRIGKTLSIYLKYFLDLKNKNENDFEIIVVLNNCSDNTLSIVEKFKYNELKILNFKQGGKGFAITEGFKESLKGNSTLIGFVDADAATPPNAFHGLIRHIGNADGIIANRWDKRSKIQPEHTFMRKITSAGYNTIIRSLFFFPFQDTQCGAKLFKRGILEKNIHKIASSQWNFDVALLFCLRRESKARIKSIPTMWSDIKGSKINLRSAPTRMFLSAIRLRIMHSPFKSFLRIYWKLIPEKWKIRQHNNL
ncbi:glycosyltransferase [Candidatus Pacearchaeota archaeon]|nr:glycosyltransferase [Candidatus Pacearchaeota archaeon]